MCLGFSSRGSKSLLALQGHQSTSTSGKISQTGTLILRLLYLKYFFNVIECIMRKYFVSFMMLVAGNKYTYIVC